MCKSYALCSGFIPEFVGRFPKKVPLQSLDEQKLYEILTQKENNILAQKELLYQDFGVSYCHSVRVHCNVALLACMGASQHNCKLSFA